MQRLLPLGMVKVTAVLVDIRCEATFSRPLDGWQRFKRTLRRRDEIGREELRISVVKVPLHSLYARLIRR